MLKKKKEAERGQECQINGRQGQWWEDACLPQHERQSTIVTQVGGYTDSVMKQRPIILLFWGVLKIILRIPHSANSYIYIPFSLDTWKYIFLFCFGSKFWVKVFLEKLMRAMDSSYQKCMQTQFLPQWLKNRLVSFLTENSRSLFFFFSFFFFLCFIYFWERETGRHRDSEGMSRGRAEREGNTESEAGSRLRAVITEPNVGLEPMNHETMTWAKVRCPTNWATLAPLQVSFLHCFHFAFTHTHTHTLDLRF